MALDSEILADFTEMLAEHGVQARWSGIDLLVLVSRTRRDQQIDLGGFVDAPDLSVRVLKNAFPTELPKFGDRIDVDGEQYRIVQVAKHPRSPLLTLTLSTTDE
jgi:hypothetical protein